MFVIKISFNIDNFVLDYMFENTILTSLITILKVHFVMCIYNMQFIILANIPL